MSQFPGFVQACLLFDVPGPFPLHRTIDAFLQEEAKFASRYAIVPGAKTDVVYRLAGDNGVTVTAEFVDGQAQLPLFEPALTLPFTRVATPDARERVARHRSHVIVGVYHGAIAPTGETGALLAKLGGPQLRGATLREYQLRLALCGRLAKWAQVLAPLSASLVHWTLTDHLMTGEAFAALAAERAPSPLHVHPLPYRAGEADGQALAGLKTLGVAHFLGKEVHVAPNPVPWIEHYAPILAFLAVATADNGYVLPDGDTFSPEDESYCYRLRDRRADASEPAHYRLELLHSAKYGFTAPDYIPSTRRFDDRALPPEVEGRLGQEKSSLVAQWRVRRERAEAAGNQFTVRYDPAALAPVRPSALRKLLRLLPGSGGG